MGRRAKAKPVVLPKPLDPAASPKPKPDSAAKKRARSKQGDKPTKEELERQKKEEDGVRSFWEVKTSTLSVCFRHF